MLGKLEYRCDLISVTGPPHRQVFTVEIVSNCNTVRGEGFTKKEAKKNATLNLLKTIKYCRAAATHEDLYASMGKEYTVTFPPDTMQSVDEAVDVTRAITTTEDKETEEFQLNEDKHPVMVLNELLVSGVLEYRCDVISETGPPHKKVFTVQMMSNCNTVCGKGPTKKEAKRNAAVELLKAIGFTGSAVQVVQNEGRADNGSFYSMAVKMTGAGNAMGDAR